MSLTCLPVEESSVKPNQIRIRVHDTDAGIIDGLANAVLSRTDIASYLLHAAVEAVRENGGRVHMPPKFRVVDDSLPLNEKPVRYKGRK